MLRFAMYLVHTGECLVELDISEYTQVQVSENIQLVREFEQEDNLRR